MSQNVEVRWVGARFLLPFAIDPAPGGAGGFPPAVLAAIEGLAFRGRPVWRTEAPHDAYTDEALEPVRRTLFETGRYWRVPPHVPAKDGAPAVEDVIGLILPKSTTVDLRGGAKARVKPLDTFGIELFLSGHGFGVLSIGLETDDMPERGSARVATELLYELSQVAERKRATLSWPASTHPSAPAPVPQPAGAPVGNRVGQPGCSVALPELARFLLPFPIRPFQVEMSPTGPGGAPPGFISGQMNVYAAVRVPTFRDKSLLDHPAHDALGSFLVGLAQLQEPQHAGNALDGCHVEQALLNRHHWAACTSIAAAHLVMDQPGDPNFNVQGPQHYLSKYFLPWLLAHYQRRYSEALVARSCVIAGTMAGGGARITGSVNSLSRDLIAFELANVFPTVSTRHVVNVWYELCREGERASFALSQAREAISRLDASLARVQSDALARASKENLDTVAHVQRNVEWIEIFIIAVYAMEAVGHLHHAWVRKAAPNDPQLAYQVAHAAHEYLRWSLIAMPLAAALVAFFTLRPDELDRPGSHLPRQVRLLAYLTVLFLVWLLLGLWLDVFAK